MAIAVVITTMAFYTFIKAYLNLPQMISLADYKPLLQSVVLDRNKKPIGLFFKQKRTIISFEEIPQHMIHAIIAAEDAQFFEHSGLNYTAIFRALLANLKAGRKVQGGSTITQQVARSLLLTREKTYVRKFKEAVLAHRMEQNLTKENILFLYLNQIYFGQGAYGLSAASQVYFKKPVADLSLAESAILAGLPQAPSAYSPLRNPRRAKERQIYVLNRMFKEGFITEDQMNQAKTIPVDIYLRKNTVVAPYYLETLRQALVKTIGEKVLLEQGMTIHSGLDLKKQQAAEKEAYKGLRSLDKRSGFRGALSYLQTWKAMQDFLLSERNNMIDKKTIKKVLLPEGAFAPKPSFDFSQIKKEAKSTLPTYLVSGDLIKAIVMDIDDNWGLVKVLVAERQGIIDLETMKWARKPNPKIFYRLEVVKKVSEVLKEGDVIWVQVKGRSFNTNHLQKRMRKRRAQNSLAQGKEQEELLFFQQTQNSETVNMLKKTFVEFEEEQSASRELLKDDYFKPEHIFKEETLESLSKRFLDLHLEQEPRAEVALLAFDQKTSEVISMIGGKNFKISKFNRALQAKRQTGSSFKPFVYLAALDKNYTPSTQLLDAPRVFQEPKTDDETDDQQENETGAQKNTDNSTEIESAKKTPQAEGVSSDLGGEQEQAEEEDFTIWSPQNHSKKFIGNILFRNALIRSMNVPTVRLIEKVGVDWVASYARRLGISSTLNLDYTLALGSSSITLFEITRAYSQIGRLGKKIDPILVHKVTDREGEVLIKNITMKTLVGKVDQKTEEYFNLVRPLYLDWKKKKEEYEKQKLQEQQGLQEKSISERAVSEENELTPPTPNATIVLESGEEKNILLSKEPPFYFENPDQLLSPQSSFIMMDLLKGAIFDSRGTGRGAQLVDRPVGGKTGTTNSYYDAWFVGFSNQIATGVWVGYDHERSLGRGEVGGRAALPVWAGYMSKAHKNIPKEGFAVPEKIIFTSIDKETGDLPSSQSAEVVKQAFLEGTEPTKVRQALDSDTEVDFFREEQGE